MEVNTSANRNGWQSSAAAILALVCAWPAWANSPKAPPTAVPLQAVHQLYPTTHPVAWRSGYQPLTGCVENTDTCNTYVGEHLQISTQSGQVRWRNHTVPVRSISLRPPTAPLPPLRWTDPGVFLRGNDNAPQAVCVDLSYDTLWGRNGASQYWKASILLLWRGKSAPPVAYRIDGYDSHCAQWRTDGKGRYLLPTIEMPAQTPHQDPRAPITPVQPEQATAHPTLVWHVCTSRQCSTAADPRAIRWDSETRLPQTTPANPAYDWDSAEADGKP